MHVCIGGRVEGEGDRFPTEWGALMQGLSPGP